MINIAAAFHVAEPKSRADFQAAFRLRWQVLRAPWGQPRGSEQDDYEPEAYHRIARLDDGTIIGTARAHFLDRQYHTAQIRYMAVDPRYRGLGVGADLLRNLEKELCTFGCRQIVMQARNDVLPFYLKNGYKMERPGETLYGKIPHTRLSKAIRKG